MAFRLLKENLGVLLIFLAAFISLNTLTPSADLNEEVAADAYSLKRAFAHVEQMSQSEHGLGFEAHSDVRGYLIQELEKLGLEVLLQKGYTSGDWANVSEPINVISRIKGSSGESAQALLLLSHYDSSPHSSFGASDAASGVATILEGIRTLLNSNEALKNDIIIVFTDAEELGLNGADLFANNHPWAEEVGLVLNFEARGSGGPSYMLIETNQGNSKLIKHFAQAGISHPVANSLAYSIYKLLPNDTDLTVFREDKDIDGFNFAFIDDHFDYHTALDRADRLDAESLAHQKTYLMPLLQYFGNADLSDLKSERDRVYFNLPAIGFVHYDNALIWPLFLIVLGLFGWAVFKRYTAGGWSKSVLGKASLYVILTVIINGIIGYFFYDVIQSLYPSYKDMLHGFTYNGKSYIAAVVALSLGIQLLILGRFKFDPKHVDVLLSVMSFLWIIIAGLLQYYLAGASFFIWIPFFMSVTLLLTHYYPEHKWIPQLLTIPAVLILTPMIEMFPVGLGLSMLVSVSLLVSLLFFACITVVFQMGAYKKWSLLAFVLFGLLMGNAHLNSSYNEERPKPTSLVYLKNEDGAYWATYDQVLHPWNASYFNDSNASNDTPQFASKYGSRFQHLNSAPEKAIADFELQMTKDSIIEDVRQLEFEIKNHRKVHRIEVFAEGALVNYVEVNESPLSPLFLAYRGKRLFTHYLSEGASTKILLQFDKNEPLNLTINEISNDLLRHPEFNVSDRPKQTIPMPFVINDAIIQQKSFQY